MTTSPAESLAQAEAFIDAVERLIVNPVRRAAEAWRNRRDYARTVDELMALDDRTLADIGISRGDIPGVAAGTQVPTDGYGNPRTVGLIARHA